MDTVISVLHYIFLGCIPVAIVVIIVKGAIVFWKKGFDLSAFCISFFRIYKAPARQQISSKSWRRYMLYNNYLNYFLYFFVLLFLFLFIFYQKNIFLLT